MLGSLSILVLGTVLSAVSFLVVGRWRRSARRAFRAPIAGDIFSVIGTGYAVLLAFVIFTALGSYQSARQSTQSEAVAVRQLYALTDFFPQPARTSLQGDVVCYARAVVVDEWPRMADGHSSARVDGWVMTTDHDIESLTLETPREAAAIAAWFSRSAERQEGRQERLAESSPYVPVIVWVMIVLLFVVVVGYQVLFADPRASMVPQLIGVIAVAATLLAGIVVVFVLDVPFADRGARIPSSPMRNAAVVLEAEHASSSGAPLPCDAGGSPSA